MVSTDQPDSANDRPLVSIGLPVYNGEKYLESALQSLLNQTYSNLELIICDNASTDSTRDICLKYAQSDPRIKYFRNDKNIGGANNHNLCFSLAKGKYFRWAAHDDVVTPDLIEDCVEFLERNPHIVLCCTDCLEIDELSGEKNIYHCANGSSPDVFERFVQLVAEHYCYEIYGLMRRETVQKIGLIRNYPDADRAFLVQLGFLGEFHSIPKPLFLKRHHPEMSIKAFPDFYGRFAWFGDEHKNRLAPPHLIQLVHLLEIITYSAIPISVKLKCYRHMMTWWIVYHRTSLVYEIARFWRRLIGRDKPPRIAVGK